MLAGRLAASCTRQLVRYGSTSHGASANWSKPSQKNQLENIQMILNKKETKINAYKIKPTLFFF
jgi:hypothetical protein